MTVSGGARAPIKVMGRYALFREIAAGGMAVVHLGRLHGPVGFSRTVAIKRLYPQYARDPEFVSMFLDEARLAARVRHPNVVPTLDVVASSGELFLVMEYVHGESLSRLIRSAVQQDVHIPPKVILTIAVGALAGLHAAHEARDAQGDPLGIVHRDISPQNILVGLDGVPRIVDFGVAKAAGRVQTTRDGQLKGKIGYFAPEQVAGAVTRKTDIFAMSIVLWEALTGRRLFRGDNDACTLDNLLHAVVSPPSAFASDVHPGIDAAVLRGLERDPAKRFETARDMALELERHLPHATSNEVGSWVERLAQETLGKRAAFVAEVEGSGPALPDDSVARIMGPSEPDPDGSDPEAETISGSIPRPSGVGVGARGDANAGSAAPEHASRPPAAESTSLSHATSLSQMSRGRPSPRRVWAVGAAFVAAVIGGFVFASTRTKVEPASAPPPSSVLAPQDNAPAPASTSAERFAQPIDVAVATSGSTEALPAPVASTAAPAAPTRPSHRRPDPRPVQPPRAPATRENHCAVPYTLDSSGRKKWKPECL